MSFAYLPTGLMQRFLSGEAGFFPCVSASEVLSARLVALIEVKFARVAPLIDRAFRRAALITILGTSDTAASAQSCPNLCALGHYGADLSASGKLVASCGPQARACASLLYLYPPAHHLHTTPNRHFHRLAGFNSHFE